VDPVKHFDLLFGGILLVTGLTALVVGIVLCIVFARKQSVRVATWMSAFLPLGLGAGFTLAGSIFCVIAVKDLQREERLLATGVTIQAAVIGPEETGSKLNGQRLWRVAYRYRGPAGRSYEGWSGYLRRVEALDWHAGDQAFIRYDPEQPEYSIWLGLSEHTGQR
jgi:hypothetical protein